MVIPFPFRTFHARKDFIPHRPPKLMSIVLWPLQLIATTAATLNTPN